MTVHIPHRRYLDALRGAAFLGVLFAHVGYFTGNFKGKAVIFSGRHGVTLFFLVSALTLGLSLQRRTNHENFPIANFFTRRFFRIAPLFWLGAAFYLFLRGTGPTHFAPAGVELWQVLTTLTFVHGWTPASINSVVPGGWSIGAEWMFYLLLPFLYPRLKTASTALGGAFLALLAAVLLNASAAKVLPGLVSVESRPLIPEFLDYWFPFHLPVFLLGLAVSRWVQQPETLALLGRRNVGFGVLLLALGAIPLFTYWIVPFVPRDFLFAVAFAGLSLYLASNPEGVLVNRPLCFLGTLSFSCYLVHFAVLELVGKWITPTFFQTLPAGNLANGARFIAVAAVTLLATMLISFLTHRWIEQPGIRLGGWLIRQREAGKTRQSIQDVVRVIRAPLLNPRRSFRRWRRIRARRSIISQSNPAS